MLQTPSTKFLIIYLTSSSLIILISLINFISLIKYYQHFKLFHHNNSYFQFIFFPFQFSFIIIDVFLLLKLIFSSFICLLFLRFLIRILVECKIIFPYIFLDLLLLVLLTYSISKNQWSTTFTFSLQEPAFISLNIRPSTSHYFLLSSYSFLHWFF